MGRLVCEVCDLPVRAPEPLCHCVLISPTQEACLTASLICSMACSTHI